MLFVAGVLKDLLTKNIENAGQHSNLRKHYILESPKDTYRHINFLENLNDSKCFVDDVIIGIKSKGDISRLENIEVKGKNNDSEEVEGDDDDCESKGTGTYIDDNIWDEVKTNISSISSNSSTNKSCLHKWKPKFLKTSSSSSLETMSSTSSRKRYRKRKQRIYKKSIDDDISNIPREDLDSISSSSRHSIKIRKEILQKLISKYNLMYGNNFKIEDEYIDDTYNDEGCFTHLEFHIF